MNKRIIKLIIEKHRHGHDMKIATYTYRFDEVSQSIYRCKTDRLSAAWPSLTKNKPCEWEFVTAVDPESSGQAAFSVSWESGLTDKS